MADRMRGSAGRRRLSSKSLEGCHEAVQERIVGAQSEREAPAAANDHGGHGEVAVSEPLGLQVGAVAATPEPAQLLGPAAQVVTDAHEQKPGPVGHEPVLAHGVETEVGLELAHALLHIGLVAVLRLELDERVGVVIGGKKPGAVVTRGQCQLFATAAGGGPWPLSTEAT